MANKPVQHSGTSPDSRKAAMVRQHVTAASKRPSAWTGEATARLSPTNNTQSGIPADDNTAVHGLYVPETKSCCGKPKKPEVTVVAMQPRRTKTWRWIPEHKSSECSGCGILFFYMNKRQQCRICQDLFCLKCSTILQLQETTKCPTCASCITQIKTRTLGCGHVNGKQLPETTQHEQKECQYYEMIKLFKGLIMDRVIIQEIVPRLPFIDEYHDMHQLALYSPRLAIDTLLEELKHSHENGKWKKFKDALDECGYERIVQAIDGANPPSDDKQRKIIRENSPKMGQMLDVRELLPVLLARNTINQVDSERIEARYGHNGMITAAHCLLRCISRRQVKWYDHFIESLKDIGRGDIAEEIAIDKLRAASSVYTKKLTEEASCGACPTDSYTSSQSSCQLYVPGMRYHGDSRDPSQIIESQFYSVSEMEVSVLIHQPSAEQAPSEQTVPFKNTTVPSIGSTRPPSHCSDQGQISPHSRQRTPASSGLQSHPHTADVCSTYSNTNTCLNEVSHHEPDTQIHHGRESQTCMQEFEEIKETNEKMAAELRRLKQKESLLCERNACLKETWTTLANIARLEKENDAWTKAIENEDFTKDEHIDIYHTVLV